MVYASSTLLSSTLSFLLWTLKVNCTRGRGRAPFPPLRDTPGWLTCSWRMRKSSYFQPRFSGLVLSLSLARYMYMYDISPLASTIICTTLVAHYVASPLIRIPICHVPLLLSLSLSLSLSLLCSWPHGWTPQ